MTRGRPLPPLNEERIGMTTNPTHVVGTNTTTATTTPPRTTTPRTSETKPAFKTTEFFAYVLAVIGVLVAAQVVDGFRASQGWLYVTLLTMGYMLSRGLAKAGSYANDADPRTNPYPAGPGGP